MPMKKGKFVCMGMFGIEGIPKRIGQKAQEWRSWRILL